MDEYIKKMFLEILTAEEQELISIFSVICREGLAVDVACNLLMNDRPRDFNSLIDKLSAQNWIFCDCQTIYIEQEVSEAVLKFNSVESHVAISLLTSLSKYIVLQPLDDMISRQQYFVAARLLLSYLMNHWDVLYANNNQLTSLFSDAVIAFATNVELSFYGNKRQLTHALEDRIDFQLLTFVKELPEQPNLVGYANLLLGRLYTGIFRYYEARTCFDKADAILNNNAELLLAKAMMYENLGIQAKTFQFAYRAYLVNKEKLNYDANINVALYISYLCGLNESNKNCKYWRKIARSLLGDRTIPVGHIFNITLKEIEALIHIGDTILAHQIMDSVELEVYRLYGFNAPEMSRIYYIRSIVDYEVGMVRKSNEHYRQYVETNHYNFGASRGDTAILYSNMISENVIRGNNDTADIITIKMQDLHAEDSSIAPGVRWSQALANYASCFMGKYFEISKIYVNDVAKKIYDKELCPDEDTLSEIAPIFKDGGIPESVLMTEHYRTIQFCNINICLKEGKINEVKELIKKETEKEKNDISRLKWNIHMGRALIIEGKQEEALELWWNILDKTPKRYKFEIAKEVAEWASFYNMEFEAKNFYDVALYYDVLVYAKASDMAEALKDYAYVLNYCGFDESKEAWEQSVLLMQSINDNDGLALLYYFWGTTRQDSEAEKLLKKAIKYWKSENNVDETHLSFLVY